MPTKILLLEKDPGMRTQFETLLSTAGYDVRAYESPEELVSHIKDREFDLTIIDTGTPEGCDEEFAKSLNGVFTKPVIYISAYGFPKRLMEICPPPPMLRMPFSPNMLVEAVENVLSTK